MDAVVGVALLVFLVPLALSIALRSTRWWWLPGASTFGIGAIVLIIVKVSVPPERGGGPPLITLAGLFCVLGAYLLPCGAVSFVAGALAKRAWRAPPPAPPPSAIQSPVDLPRARMVNKPQI